MVGATAPEMASPVADVVLLLYREIEFGLALAVQTTASREARRNGGR